MDFFDVVKKRYSVRKYSDAPVEDEKLNQILNAGRMAPSASNRQEWRFVVVKDLETRKKLKVAAKNQHFVETAPITIACLAQTDNHVMTCGQQCYPIDVAIAIDHMTLAATALGLGTCWIGAFDAEAVKTILNVPKEMPVVELFTLGYPTTQSVPAKKRLPLEELVRFEKWD